LLADLCLSLLWRTDRSVRWCCFCGSFHHLASPDTVAPRLPSLYIRFCALPCPFCRPLQSIAGLTLCDTIQPLHTPSCPQVFGGASTSQLPSPAPPCFPALTSQHCAAAIRTSHNGCCGRCLRHCAWCPAWSLAVPGVWGGGREVWHGAAWEPGGCLLLC
jgi:hypothetical protein